MTHPTPTRRTALALGGAALATPLATPLFAQEARSVESMSIGSADAPVTIVEYASLTCPHCARFHTDVYGQIKENYIDTGKVRLVVNEVYFDRYGLWAAMIARCGGETRYFGIIDRLYTRQAEWSRLSDATEAVGAMMAIGRQAGMTDDQMTACMSDQDWAEGLVARYQENMERDAVQGTPTFFINGQMENNMSYDEFAQKLDLELGS